jgi:hypothetical protein
MRGLGASGGTPRGHVRAPAGNRIPCARAPRRPDLCETGSCARALEPGPVAQTYARPDLLRSGNRAGDRLARSSNGGNRCLDDFAAEAVAPRVRRRRRAVRYSPQLSSSVSPALPSFKITRPGHPATAAGESVLAARYRCETAAKFLRNEAPLLSAGTATVRVRCTATVELRRDTKCSFQSPGCSGLS